MFACSIVCLQSCKKDKKTAPTEKAPVKLLTRIIQTDGTRTTAKTFAYDEKNRLKTYKDPYTINTYTYNADNIAKIESTNIAGVFLWEFSISMTAGKPVSATQIFTDKTRTFGYLYDGDNVKQINVTQNGVVINITKYASANHNLTWMTEEYGQGLVKTEFTYGTKKSMYSTLGLNYLIGTGAEDIERYSVNEILEWIIYLPDGSINLTTKNVYTYDSDGFPITQISTSTYTGGTTVTKYTYEYSTF